MQFSLPTMSDELQEMVDSLPAGETQDNLKTLVASFGDLRFSLDAAGELLGKIEVPAEPDQDLIQQRLRQCKVMHPALCT